LLGIALLTGKTLNVPNVEQESRYFPAVKKTRSELVVPIRHECSILGVINSESEEIAGYDDAACMKIEAIADSLGALLPIYGWDTTNPPANLPLIELAPIRQSGKVSR
jgi:putative methionine-R-sulfoxide reductase with GAF domain